MYANTFEKLDKKKSHEQNNQKWVPRINSVKVCS